MLSKTVPALHILRNAIVVKIILLQLGWFMFEKIKTTLEKDYYLNSNPFFFWREEKVIDYIYLSQPGFCKKKRHMQSWKTMFSILQNWIELYIVYWIYIYTGYPLHAVRSLTYWKLVRLFSSFWKHVIIDRKMIRYIVPEIKITYNFFQRKLMSNSSTTMMHMVCGYLDLKDWPL